MRNIPPSLESSTLHESKEHEIFTSKRVRRPMLVVAALAAVGFGLVYASATSSRADASRFWVNTVTAETTPSK